MQKNNLHLNPLLLALGSFTLGTVATWAADAASSTNAPAVPPPPPKPKWETTAAVGFTLAKGNSDTMMLTANILTLRKWEKNELSMGADGSYGESDNKTSTQTAHGYIQYNRLFTERLYGYARADGLYDKIADLQYRVTLSPGLGYYFIKNDKTTLSGEVGPGYIMEEQGHDTHNYFTVRFAEKFTQKLTDRARIWESIEYLPQVDDWGRYLVNFEAGIEADITKDKKFKMRTYVQDMYNSKPAPNRKQNDVRLVAGFGYTF